MAAGGGLLAGHLPKFPVLILIQRAVLNTTRREGEGFAQLSLEDWSGFAGLAGLAEEAIESSQVEDTGKAQEDYNRVAVGLVHRYASELADGQVPDSHAQVETL